MPKKNRFPSVIPPKKPEQSACKKNQLGTEKLTPNKKFKNANAIMWLQEAYDSARGEKALWVAVITQAMMDALSHSKKSEAIYQKHEAICWLTSNSKDFIDICLSADMSPDYVRLKAKKVLAAPIPWRAEAGKGKRYHERKEYRKAQKLKEKEESLSKKETVKIISMF